MTEERIKNSSTRDNSFVPMWIGKSLMSMYWYSLGPKNHTRKIDNTRKDFKLYLH